MGAMEGCCAVVILNLQGYRRRPVCWVISIMPDQGSLPYYDILWMRPYMVWWAYLKQHGISGTCCTGSTAPGSRYHASG